MPGFVGLPELLLLGLVVLLVFGPKRLPELGRSLGQSLAEFRRAGAELRNAMNAPPEPVPAEVRSVPALPAPAQADAAAVAAAERTGVDGQA